MHTKQAEKFLNKLANCISLDCQNSLEQLKKEIADWESDIQQGIERNRILKKREMEEAIIESENAKERKKAKEDSLNEKIETIDKALERIEEISKTSPTIQ